MSVKVAKCGQQTPLVVRGTKYKTDGESAGVRDRLNTARWAAAGGAGASGKGALRRPHRPGAPGPAGGAVDRPPSPPPPDRSSAALRPAGRGAPLAGAGGMVGAEFHTT